jgi:hypothetical protein
MFTIQDVTLNFISDTLVDLQITTTTGSGISQFHMLPALQSEMRITAATFTHGPMQHLRPAW